MGQAVVKPTPAVAHKQHSETLDNDALGLICLNFDLDFHGKFGLCSRSIFFSGFNWQFCTSFPSRHQRFLHDRITKYSKYLQEASIANEHDLELLQAHLKLLKALEIDIKGFNQGLEPIFAQLAESGNSELQSLALVGDSDALQLIPSACFTEILSRVSFLQLEIGSGVDSLAAILRSCRSLQSFRFVLLSEKQQELQPYVDIIKRMCQSNSGTLNSLDIDLGDSTWAALFSAFPLAAIEPSDGGWTIQSLQEECKSAYAVDFQQFCTSFDFNKMKRSRVRDFFAKGSTKKSRPRDIMSSLWRSRLDLSPSQEQSIIELFKCFYGRDVSVLPSGRQRCILHNLKLASQRLSRELSDDWAAFAFEVLQSVLSAPSWSQDLSSTLMSTLFAYIGAEYCDPSSVSSFVTILTEWIESNPQSLMPSFRKKLIKSKSASVDAALLDHSLADWMDRVGFRLDEVIEYSHKKEILAYHLIFSRKGRLDALARLPQFDVGKLTLHSGETIWDVFWRKFKESWSIDEKDLSTLLRCYMEKKAFDETQLCDLLLEGLLVVSQERHWFSKLFNKSLQAAVDSVTKPFSAHVSPSKIKSMLVKYIHDRFNVDLVHGVEDLPYLDPESDLGPSMSIAVALWYDLIRSYTPESSSQELLARLNLIAQFNERAPDFIVNLLKKKEQETLPVSFANKTVTSKSFRQALEGVIKSSNIKLDAPGCSVM